MNKIGFSQTCLHVAPVTAFLQVTRRIVVSRLQMIHIGTLVLIFRNGGENGIGRISLVGTKGVFRASHGNAVVIAGAALGTHEIVIPVPPGQMWRL